jgi:hypothetical protein
VSAEPRGSPTAVRAAFEERLPRLKQLADGDDAGVALKAMDLLGKYGGMSYTEAEARVEVTRAAEVIRYELPEYGRERRLEPASPQSAPPQSAPPRATRPAARATRRTGTVGVMGGRGISGPTGRGA